MKLKPKTLVLISLSIVFIFFTKNSFAQYPGMSQLRQSWNNQWMNQQMSMRMGMMQFGHTDNASNPEYDFVALMKDGSEKNVTSRIYSDDINHKTYILFVNKKLKKTDTNRNVVIYPNQTTRITLISRLSGGSFIGIPVDSCWMFRIQSGAISLYSYKAETDDDASFDFSTCIGLQKSNGPIKAFNEPLLKNLLTTDAEAMELFYKQEYYKAIKKFNKNAEKPEENKPISMD